MKQLSLLCAFLLFSTSSLTLAHPWKIDLITESLSVWLNRFSGLQGRRVIIFTGNPSHPLVSAFRQAAPSIPIFTPSHVGEMQTLFPINPLVIVIGTEELGSTHQNLDPLAIYIAGREGQVLPLLCNGQRPERYLPVFLRFYHTIKIPECSTGMDLLIRSILRATGETNKLL